MKSLYFDYNASTPLDPRVLQKMMPYFCQDFANPNSSHVQGWTARKALDHAREQVAALMGCHARDVIFTSGASESTTLALLGVFYDQTLHKKNLKPHFITTDVEHACVQETMKLMEKLGAEITVLSTQPYGQVSSQQLQEAIQPNTVLASVIWVNNEVGTINPVAALAEVAKKAGVLFHTDATQGAGKIPFHFENMGVDLMSFSSHKIYGPKGVGALIRRHKQPRVELVPLITGGGQEFGLRAGTQNVPGIVGLGEACDLCREHMEQDAQRAASLGQQLMQGLRQIFPDLILNGHPTERSVFNYNVTFPSFNLGLHANALLEVCYSRGSACHSNDPTKRDVLTSLGVNENLVTRSLRLSLGRMSVPEDIVQLLEIFQKIATNAQQNSPGGFGSRIESSANLTNG